ncbi:MAG: TonB family protein [Elusimicrobiota bacterium]|jgi:protein TonB
MTTAVRLSPRDAAREVLRDAGLGDAALNPFLLRSALAHGAAAVALFALVQAHWVKPEQVYRIDFIGATGTIQNRDREAGARPSAPPAARPAAAKPAPLRDPDAFPVRRLQRSLPRPSILESPDAKPERRTAPAPAAEAPPSASKGLSVGPGSGGSVAPDMPNFPYPWYLTSMRSSLWDRWAKRMPDLAGECGIAFTVLRDGGVVDLLIETSSGDGGFDYAALSAAREAGPFPPLPSGFPEPFLRVHVNFRSG